jgi:uncharacterized protein (TIGR03032 family)
MTHLRPDSLSPLMESAADRSHGEDADPGAEKGRLECRADDPFLSWLEQAAGTILATTYNSGKLALLSCLDGSLRLRIHNFARPMGLAINADRLAIAAQQSIRMFDRQALDPNEPFDAVYASTAKNETGKLDIHDLVFAGARIYFANTKYNCIARTSETHRFARSWQPDFISRIASGDRCHLNGIGVRDGRLSVVTAFCQSDQRRGWKEQDRFTGGILIDMHSKEIIARGLCMPHSPRWHDNRWWFCNSGRGTLCTLDAQGGSVNEVCMLPGFVRGLSFVGQFALVGLSRIRENHILDPTPICKQLRAAKSGIALVDTRAGQMVGLAEFIRGGREIYDVTFLEGVQRLELRGC